MIMKKKDFALGILCGAMLFSGVTAAATGITAEPTWQTIYVDAVSPVHIKSDLLTDIPKLHIV